MTYYTFGERADIIFMYGGAKGNGREAPKLYKESFPNRHQPNHKIFAVFFERLGENDSVWRKNPLEDKGRPRMYLLYS